MHARTASRPRGARIAAFGATALLASASLLVTSVSLVRASTAPYAHGSITGEVGCAQQLHPGGCPSMNEESPAGNPDWSFDRTIALTEGGNAESAKATLAFHEVDDAKGFLGGLTMTGEMHIDVTPAGHASARGVFSADFATLAPTLSLVGSATVDSKGTDSIGSSAAVHVRLDCGAVDESVTSTAGFDIPTGHQVVSLTRTVDVFQEGPSGQGACDLNVTLDAGGGTDRGGGGGQNTESAVSFSLTILAAPAPSPTPGGCALAGIVYDGDITSDFHNNPMPHIPVQLFRDGAAVDEPVTTDAVGHYCIPEGIAEPGDYRLRATLADVPLLETRHTSDVGATWTDVPIVATDFGRQNADISFTHSDTRPWLPDVANIHWQATRYVEWLTDTLELAPGLMGPATIIAFDPTRTAFDARNHRITISVSDSVFNSRSDSSSIGPAGIEWHELTHHLLEAIGAGAADNCPLQDPDGSWDNASTCASLDEGIALFLPALAAADLNPTAAESVSFGIHANLEDNDYYPWSFVSLGNVTAQRESFAVAQLLWDLTDDTPLERAPIAFTATPVATFTGSDTIAYGVDQLFHVIAAEPHPTTVDDLFKFIAVDLPPGTLANGIDIDGSGSTDADPLQELLLIHGFHPVHDPMFPSYFIGTTVGRTDHVPVPSSAPDLFVRNRPVALPGESIRFTNPGSTAVTYSIDITYPGATSHFDVPVPAGGERVFEFEPPPYWRGALAAGAALPACGADQVKVSVALSGGGETPRTVDGCEYLHLASAAGSGSALSFGRAATALAVPALGLIAALLGAGLIVALIGGVILLRRRRPAAG